MKFRHFAIVFTLMIAAATLVVGQVKAAQSGPGAPGHYTALTPSQHDAVDLVATKMENAMLRYQQLLGQFNQAKAQMEADYKTQLEAMNKLLDADKKSLGLPANAVFTGTSPDPKQPNRPTFSFEIPTNGAPAKPDSAPAKK